jgi:hypothetical protein
MTWTREKPTTPGWYWYQSRPDSTPMIVQIYAEKVWCAGILDGGPISSLDGKWAGPIESPQEMNEKPWAT